MSAPLARLAFACGLLAACGPPPGPAAPVPVDGTPGDRRALAGDWAGVFATPDGGSRGTIAFTLSPARDTAYGYVAFDGTLPPACTDAVSAAVRPPAAGRTILRFGRVVVGAGSIAGWLQSYPDPALGCPVDTWFEGRLVGDTLRGMFFAHPAAGDTVRRGTWWAGRARRR